MKYRTIIADKISSRSIAKVIIPYYPGGIEALIALCPGNSIQSDARRRLGVEIPGLGGSEISSRQRRVQCSPRTHVRTYENETGEIPFSQAARRHGEIISGTRYPRTCRTSHGFGAPRSAAADGAPPAPNTLISDQKYPHREFQSSRHYF